MVDFSKPLPNPTPDSQPYWDSLKAHRMSLQKCTACSSFIHYPRSRCPECGADAFEWVPVSGRGTVYTYTIARMPTHPAFGKDAPYTIAIVELEEGVRVTSNVIDCAPEAVKVGMPVEVVYEDVNDEITLAKFKPAA
ncbi:MAG: Zn-ribbon domain-containing OB-fold protein [Gammaproteobacteria bacterium]|nr:Zn-ribbon domain-containing OB-fold protein [Gammaproteobacteria bacterium]